SQDRARGRRIRSEFRTIPANSLVRCPGDLGCGKLALRALAVSPQIFPGVDSGRVAVEPVELNRVATHGVGTRGLRRRLIHRKEFRCFLPSLPNLPPFVLPLVHACGTRTAVAQPDKAPRAPVAVRPVNLQSLALREQ